MSFLQRTPFLRLLIPVVTGIILYQYIKFPLWILWVLFVVSITLITTNLLLKKSFIQYKFRWLFGCGIFLFFTTLFYFLSYKAEQKNQFEHIGKKGFYEVELVSMPMEKVRSYLYEVKILQFSDSALFTPSSGRAYLYFQKDSAVSTLLYGDRLLVEAEFNPPTTIRNPDGFDYANYLKHQGIGATTYVTSGSWVKTKESPKTSVFLLANKCRNYLLDIYKKHGISGQEYAVLAALALGYTDEIDLDLWESYSTSGVMHVLSVSGLHVGIIYAVLAFLFSFLNKSLQLRIIKSAVILMLLWCYAFITGLSPSVFRSTLMFSFVALGTISNRKPQIYNTIFMSAFLMLLINPDWLFSVSFQLSYTAVLSIVYFQPKLSRLLQIKNKPIKWAWDLSAVSVAAQIGTTPLVLLYFQSFPNYFLLTNLIAIPATTFILYLAFTLLLFSFIPVLPSFIALLLKWILQGLNSFIIFTDRLPYATSVIGINHFQILLLFAIIILASYYFQKRNYFVLISVLCTFLIFLTIGIQAKYNTLQSQKLIVYESYRDTHINILNGNQNYTYTTNEDELHRIASAFWTNNKILPPKRIEEYTYFSDGFFIFNNKRILILQEDYGQKHKTATPIEVDYLIIGNKLKPRINQLLDCVVPKMIICDNTITPWYTEQTRKICEERNISFHSVRKDGVYMVSF